MKVWSDAFGNKQMIPRRYTCDGDNVNPPLNIEEVPPNAETLAVVLEDPDAASKNFTHWLLWNIPANHPKLNADMKPEGAFEGKNDAGSVGYMGACPKSGLHRYVFKVYALDGMLGLEEGASKEELLKAMRNHIIERTEMVGMYAR